jgi:hypothetical protein
VEDGGEVDLVAIGVFEAHRAGNDTTIIEPYGTVIVELWIDSAKTPFS